MARYIVNRPFPDKMPMRAGQIVEDPQWRDLAYLISRGYVAKVSGKAAKKLPTAREVPAIEVSAEVAEVPAVTAPAEIATETIPETTETPSLASSPLEQVAAAAVADPNQAPEETSLPTPTPNLSKMTKAQLVAHAESVGVTVVPDKMTNKQIIAAIEAAQ